MSPRPFAVADALLRDPAAVIARCHDAQGARDVARAALLVVAVGGAVFGATLGAFRGELQPLFAALKIPVATLLTLAVGGPALWAIARAFDRRWTLKTTLALMLASGARSSLVLLAAAPLVGIAIGFGLPYSLLKQLAAIAYGMAGLSGLSFALMALGPAEGRNGAVASFVGVFLVVGAQAAWILRPFIGDPADARPPLFAHGRAEGGVTGSLLGGRPAPPASSDPR